MSCSTLIGVTASGGAYAARWLHWGGDPEQIIPLLRRIWQHSFTRHTLATAEALLRHDWVTLDPAATRASQRHGRRPVPGVGYATDLQDGTRRGRIDEAAQGYLEWMYLVDVATDTVLVHEATCHSRWLRHSQHPLDPAAAGTVLGCGGYTDHGHRWNPAHLWLPGARAGLDAEVCLAAHPHGAPVLRFTDATAHAITAATTPNRGEAGRQASWLRGVGMEFDLMWAARRANGPHRLRRDADGLLLLDVDVAGWSWWLLPAPVEGATR
ncbi:hypothetical protein [Micromonospora inositola]|uniref:Uncharacterized protein n=1 Tax=Micromonospora inositola TaxID=47865 RepID=A0A1C5K4I4_9ACTN|nr:hypothetical protein [Micromonospora inositola]SCG77688.1 hypothetical protein GA0070613_6345 [Micromonospora inositola]